MSEILDSIPSPTEGKKEKEGGYWLTKFDYPSKHSVEVSKLNPKHRTLFPTFGRHKNNGPLPQRPKEDYKNLLQTITSTNCQSPPICPCPSLPSFCPILTK